jgi:hypothetical protein
VEILSHTISDGLKEMLKAQTPKGSLSYRAIRRSLGAVGLIKAWEYLSSYYLWRAFPLNGRDHRLFQIVGVPRSGTTLLCALLASHSKVICLSEPYHQWKYDGFVDTTDFSELLGSKVWKKHPGLLVKQICIKEKNKLIGFKETYYSHSHGHYSNHYFFKRNHTNGVLTIGIIRDPREIWKSLIQKHPEMKGKLTVKFTESWNDLVRWILDSNIFYVRYEELLNETSKSLRKVCDYLNIKFEQHMINPKPLRGRGDENAKRGIPVIKNKINEYERYLSEDEILYIEKYCGSEMKKLGYLK